MLQIEHSCVHIWSILVNKDFIQIGAPLGVGTSPAYNILSVATNVTSCQPVSPHMNRVDKPKPTA